MTKDELEKEILNRTDITDEQKIKMIKVLKEKETMENIPQPDDLLLG